MVLSGVDKAWAVGATARRELLVALMVLGWGIVCMDAHTFRCAVGDAGGTGRRLKSTVGGWEVFRRKRVTPPPASRERRGGV